MGSTLGSGCASDLPCYLFIHFWFGTLDQKGLRGLLILAKGARGAVASCP